MAPDRGPSILPTLRSKVNGDHENEDHELAEPFSTPLSSRMAEETTKRRSDHGCYAPEQLDPSLECTNFTFRGVAVGLAIGIIICFSNTYFGLQTGWISGMAMPASLIGFATFKTLSKHLTLPFTPVENILVQTVAGALGTMPLGLGFVGVMPSLEFLLKKSEGAPMDLSLWRLIVWGFGLCLFGVVFAIPLRKQVIIREKLKFPSGTATALMVSLLHGSSNKTSGIRDGESRASEEREGLLDSRTNEDDTNSPTTSDSELKSDWKRQIRLLLMAFGGSGAYTLLQYFFPILHKLPVFGNYLAKTWVWTLNPSPAYVGQGIIMGPATSFHMLLGAIIGWAVLSPLAKREGWAPGPVSDWETGSKGWIVWVSLAIMLADSLVNISWLVLQPTIKYGPGWISSLKGRYQHASDWKDFFFGQYHNDYMAVSGTPSIPQNHVFGSAGTARSLSKDEDEYIDEAPADQLVSNRVVFFALPLTLVICMVCIHISFGDYIPISLNIFAILLALILSVMGVRALGETDLNPVSGISKLTQLIFALTTPTGKHANHAIVINLLAGAVSEAGALQAGDMLQDLKAGHLIGASPKAQFYGLLIGSVVGAFVSAAVYKLYVSVYTIPGELFQIPTAYVWVFTARLVTGKGLPPMAWEYALCAGAIFVVTTSLRIYLVSSPYQWCRKLHPFIPGGIAVAVGIYNTPSFTLARTVGGIISLWWTVWKKQPETRVIVLASGLILGEGVLSIVNLILASAGVPHL